MDLTDEEFELLYLAVCDRLADYVHHYPDEFTYYGGDIRVFGNLYEKVSEEHNKRDRKQRGLK